jgi:hypothetical protein
MPGFNTAEATPLMKEVYLPPVRELIDNATPLLKYVEKEIQEIPGGSDFIIPLHTGRNEAAGDGRAENGTLATPGSQTYNKTNTSPKFLYSRIRVSGPVMAATKNNKGAFLKALESEMKGVTTDTKKAFNRQLHSNGIDPLGVHVSGTGTATHVVADGFGNRFDHFNKTQLVDIVDHTNTTVSVSGVRAKRSALVATGRNIKLRNAADTADSAQAAAAGNFYIKSGTLGQQMMGLDGIVSAADPNAVLYTAGLQKLKVADEPDWAAQVVYATGSSEATTAAGRADISFEGMQEVLTAISTGSDFEESDVNLLLTSYGVRNKYVQLCRNERVFYNNMTLDGGFKAVSYNGKPLVPDAQCKRNRLYFLVTETLKLFRLADLDWIDVGGDVLYRISGGDVDAVGATLYVYQEFGVMARNANGVLLNVIE